MQQRVMKLRWAEAAAGNRDSTSMEIQVEPEGREKDSGPCSCSESVPLLLLTDGASELLLFDERKWQLFGKRRQVHGKQHT